VRGHSAMGNSVLARRKLLYGTLALAATSRLVRPRESVAGTLPLTPVQTAGPFYPITFPQDSDNDLVHVSGHAGTARGAITRITGRVLDPNRSPVSGARVEIWQCDANGRYHYVRDDRVDQPRDEDFQGYGTATTDIAGNYEFLTIRPVPYPGRTPHIHFAVFGGGFKRLVTQMYVAGEPGNESDPVLMSVRDPAARTCLIVSLHPLDEGGSAALAGTFDIVIGRRG
jgi:protocatechuate 3,4-dioxygenase, beta subunit